MDMYGLLEDEQEALPPDHNTTASASVDWDDISFYPLYRWVAQSGPVPQRTVKNSLCSQNLWTKPWSTHVHSWKETYVLNQADKFS